MTLVNSPLYTFFFFSYSIPETTYHHDFIITNHYVSNTTNTTAHDDFQKLHTMTYSIPYRIFLAFISMEGMVTLTILSVICLYIHYRMNRNDPHLSMENVIKELETKTSSTSRFVVPSPVSIQLCPSHFHEELQVWVDVQKHPSHHSLTYSRYSFFKNCH